MKDFNERVRLANTAYLFKFGTKPPPGLVMDLARNQYVKTDEIRGLIDFLPQSGRHARVKQYADSGQRLEPRDTGGTKETEFLRKATGIKTPTAESVTGDAFQAQVAGYNPSRADWTAITDLPRQSQEFIKGFAIGLPVLAITEAKAVYSSAKQGSLDPLKRTNKAIGSGFLQSFSEMVDDPRHNSLNWLLVAAAGAGAVERTVGALGAGSLRAAGRTLVRGVEPGTTKLHYRDFEFEAQNAQNPLFRVAQEVTRNIRQAAADRRLERGGYALPAADRIIGRSPFSFEAKVRREIDRKVRAETIFGMQGVKDVQAAAGWSESFANKMRKLPKNARKGLTVGENTALMVDSFGLTGTWSERIAQVRGFYERQLELGLADETTTSGVIAALKLADAEMVNPSKRYLKVRGFIEDASNEATTLKIEKGGLQEVSATRRVGAPARMIAGEVGSRKEALSELSVLRRNLAEGKGDAAAIEARIVDLKAQLKTAPRNIGTTRERLNARLMELSAKPEYLNEIVPSVAARRIQGEINKLKGLQAARHTERKQAVEKYGQDAVDKKIAALEGSLQNLRQVEKTKTRGEILQVRAARLQRQFDDSVAAYKRQADATPDNAFYVPLVPLEKTPRLAKSFRGPRVLNGVPNYTMRTKFPEVYHEFTGSAFRAGNIRLDVANLTALNLGRAVRGTMLLDLYQTYRQMAVKDPSSIPETFRIPIRQPHADKWPDDVKKVFNRTDQGELTSADAATLAKGEVESLVKLIFPKAEDVKGEDVLWLDSRLLGAEARVQPNATGALQFAERINAPFRAVTLYGRPAYIANLAGSAAMGLVYQGPLLPVNMYKAFRAKQIYGEDASRLFHELVGAGKANSYVDETLNRAITRKTAHFWNVVTDRNMRTSSLIFFLKKKGLDDNAIKQLVKDVRKGDEKARSVMLDARDRANKSMVQFDNLSHVEKEYLRHFIFVYPWTRGAVVWSMKTALDRPLTSAALSEMGLDEYDKLDSFLEQMPKWFKTAGYIPLKWLDNGNPVVVNTAGISTPATLNSLLHSSPADLAPPGMDLVVSAYTGKDRFGNDYPHKQEWQSYATNLYYALGEQLAQLPQARGLAPVRSAIEFFPGWERFTKRQPGASDVTADKNLDITKRGSPGQSSSKLSAYLKAAHEAAFTPGYWGGVGQILGGASFTPREANVPALIGRAYKDLPDDKKLDLQRQFTQDVLTLQGQFLGRRVPDEIRNLVSLPYEIDKALLAKKESGELQTPADDVHATLDYLHGRMFISDSDYAERKKDLKRAEKNGISDPNWWTGQKADLIKEYGGSDALSLWDEDVKAGWAVTKPSVVKTRIQALIEDGILEGDKDISSLKQTDLIEYGRQVAHFKQEYARRLEEVTSEADKTQAEIKKDAFRTWVDSQDKPFVVRGKKLPSLVRMDWAEEIHSSVRQSLVARTATQGWDTLDRYQKQLLGVDPKGSNGWGVFQQTVDEFAAKQKPGERSKTEDLQNAAAEYIDKYVAPGFLEDYRFSKKPLGVRLEKLNLNEKAPVEVKQFWKGVYASAEKAAYYLTAKNADGSKKFVTTGLKDAWNDYVTNQLLPYAAERPQVAADLNRYLSPNSKVSILYKLLDS